MVVNGKSVRSMALAQHAQFADGQQGPESSNGAGQSPPGVGPEAAAPVPAPVPLPAAVPLGTAGRPQVALSLLWCLGRADPGGPPETEDSEKLLRDVSHPERKQPVSEPRSS